MGTEDQLHHLEHTLPGDAGSIAHAIQRVERLTRAAKPIHIRAHPDYKEVGQYDVINTLTGAHETHRATRVPPGADAITTQALVHLIDQDLALIPEGRARIFFNDSGILAHFEDAFGSRWRHKMLFQPHPAAVAVESLLNSVLYKQKDLVRFLRSQLNGHTPAHIIETFRHLRISGSSDGESAVAQGRETYGRSITEKVSTETGGIMPDDITVTIPVFDLQEVRDLMVDVTVLTDAELDNNKQPVFRLTTVRNSLNAAKELVLTQLEANLREALSAQGINKLPIIHGTTTSQDNFPGF